MQIHCDGRAVDVLEGESVLDALLRAGFSVTHSCRAGVCQSCVARAVDGVPPGTAQIGLKRERAARGYFMTCRAIPDRDMKVTLSDTPTSVGAVIRSARFAAPDVVRLTLSLLAPLEYRAGQFVVVVRPVDGLSRSYSLASVPSDDGLIEIHVRVVTRGAMSSWLASAGVVGQEVRILGPGGDCFYMPGHPDQPLLLAGVGTGLAPLVGILRDALAQGHRGPITLVHGARTRAGLYMVDELRAIARRHAHVEYVPCALEGGVDGNVTNEADGDVKIGAMSEVLSETKRSLADHRVFLCGDAELVHALRRQVFLAGAHHADIHADAFVGTPRATTLQAQTAP